MRPELNALEQGSIGDTGRGEEDVVAGDQVRCRQDLLQVVPAIQRGGELLFARNATPGGKAFTDALASAFSTTESKAEQMKLAKGDGSDDQ